MNIGASCSIVRTCEKCKNTKHYLQFPAKKGKRKRGKYCKECNSGNARKKEILMKKRYLSIRGDEKFEKLLELSRRLSSGERLSTTNVITKKYTSLLGKYCLFKNGKIFIKNPISTKEALIYIEEGSCRILTEFPYILVFYYPIKYNSLKPIILQRDNNTCFYCGEYGDTIDHMTSKFNGGLNTPKNCVCSCFKCNNEKGDMNFEEYILKRKEKGKKVINKARPTVSFNPLGKLDI